MSRFWLCCIPFVALITVGCSRGDYPEVAKTTGVVMLGEEPVAGAMVAFNPVGGGSRFSYGTTDENGRFTLSTFEKDDGGLVGKHKVTVAKMNTEDRGAIDVEAMKKGGIVAGMKDYKSNMSVGGKAAPKLQSLVPEKYTKNDTTTLEFEIKDGEDNDFTIKLEP